MSYLVKGEVIAIYIVFSIMFFFFYLLRLFSLVIFPDSLKYNNAVNQISITQVEATLLYLNLTTFVVAFSLCIASRIKIKSCATPFPTNLGININIRSVLLLFIVVISIIAYKRFWLGAGSYGSEFHDLPAIKKLIFTISTNWAVLVLLIVAILQMQMYQLPKKIYAISILILIAFIMIEVVGGKKSSILTIIIFLLFVKLTINGDFKFSALKTSMILVLASILGLSLFFIGRIFQALTFVSNISWENIWGIYNLATQYNLVTNISEGMVKFFARLSSIDPLTLALHGDQDLISRYVNFNHTIKSILNLFLPGQPYDVVNISRTFPIIFFGHEYPRAAKISTTHMWTMEGINFAHFGYFGSLFTIFFQVFIFAFLYKVACRSRLKYKFFIKISILYLFYWFVQNFGYDEFIFVMAKWVLFGLVYLVLLNIMSRLTLKKRSSLL